MRARAPAADPGGPLRTRGTPSAGTRARARDSRVFKKNKQSNEKIFQTISDNFLKHQMCRIEMDDDYDDPSNDFCC